MVTSKKDEISQVALGSQERNVCLFLLPEMRQGGLAPDQGNRFQIMTPAAQSLEAAELKDITQGPGEAKDQVPDRLFPGTSPTRPHPTFIT